MTKSDGEGIVVGLLFLSLGVAGLWGWAVGLMTFGGGLVLSVAADVAVRGGRP